MNILMEAQNQRAMRAYDYHWRHKSRGRCVRMIILAEAQNQRAMLAYDYPDGGAPEGNACV